MIEVCKNINNELKSCLDNASEVWVAVAMMSNGGLSLFKNLDNKISQNHIIGIDLPTPPKILKTLFNLIGDTFSAKIYQTKYTFHPKLYIIKNIHGNYTAFVGSSNATKSGLNNNVELNLKTTNNQKCLELINWYKNIDKTAKLITPGIIDEYSKSYNSIKNKANRIEEELYRTKLEIGRLDSQFFSRNHHAVFTKEFRSLNNKSINAERKKVRCRLIDLHNRIYPRFKEFELDELYATARGQERTSKAFINPYSGKWIGSVWLHYGKSPNHLSNYKTAEERSFINHARIQVIIHEKSVGIWLVLGKNNGSIIDRLHFQKVMEDSLKKISFNKFLKKLNSNYWIRYDEGRGVKTSDVESIDQLNVVLQKENFGEYFIIGQDIPFDSDLLSDEYIEVTVLSEFRKLYPLYQFMTDK